MSVSTDFDRKMYKLLQECWQQKKIVHCFHVVFDMYINDWLCKHNIDVARLTRHWMCIKITTMDCPNHYFPQFAEKEKQEEITNEETPKEITNEETPKEITNEETPKGIEPKITEIIKIGKRRIETPKEETPTKSLAQRCRDHIDQGIAQELARLEPLVEEAARKLYPHVYIEFKDMPLQETYKIASLLPVDFRHAVVNHFQVLGFGAPLGTRIKICWPRKKT